MFSRTEKIGGGGGGGGGVSGGGGGGGGCSVRPCLRADSGVKRSVTKVVQVRGYKYHN